MFNRGFPVVGVISLGMGFLAMMFGLMMFDYSIVQGYSFFGNNCGDIACSSPDPVTGQYYWAAWVMTYILMPIMLLVWISSNFYRWWLRIPLVDEWDVKSLTYLL